MPAQAGLKGHIATVVVRRGPFELVVRSAQGVPDRAGEETSVTHRRTRRLGLDSDGTEGSESVTLSRSRKIGSGPEGAYRFCFFWVQVPRGPEPRHQELDSLGHYSIKHWLYLASCSATELASEGRHYAARFDSNRLRPAAAPASLGTMSAVHCQCARSDTRVSFVAV